MSVKWFRSFLSNRTQRVRIDDELSQLENLVSGVPQGGILSPLLYILCSTKIYMHFQLTIIKASLKVVTNKLLTYFLTYFYNVSFKNQLNL